MKSINAAKASLSKLINFLQGKYSAIVDEEGVRTIRNFGRKLVWLAKKINT